MQPKEITKIWKIRLKTIDIHLAVLIIQTTTTLFTQP